MLKVNLDMSGSSTLAFCCKVAFHDESRPQSRCLVHRGQAFSATTRDAATGLFPVRVGRRFSGPCIREGPTGMQVTHTHTPMCVHMHAFTLKAPYLIRLTSPWKTLRILAAPHPRATLCQTDICDKGCGCGLVHHCSSSPVLDH